MNLSENLLLAWEALLANRMRAVLTMLGIIIGVGSVITVVAIGRGTRTAVLAEFSMVSANTFQIMALPPEGSGAGQKYEQFNADDIRLLKSNIPELRDVLVFDGWRAQARWGTRNLWTDLTGVSADYTRVVKLDIGSGRFFTPTEDAQGARVLVLGADAARKMFGERRPLGQTVHVGGYPFRVIGVLAPDTGLLSRAFGQGADRLWMAPVTTVRRITGAKEFQMLMGEARDEAGVDAAMRAAQELIKKRHPGGNYIAFGLKQITDAVGRVAGILTAVIGAIAGISLLVGGVGIMNIMLVSVTERTREIGIRKAIGATRLDIMLQFLIEAVVVSLAGGIIGTALAAVPVWLVGRLLKVDILVSWDSVALALGFSVAVGVIFGVYPANKAAAKDPIEALRYE